MHIAEQLTAEAVKDILQLDSNIVRLEVLRKKTQRQKEFKNIGEKVKAAKQNQDIEEQNKMLGECMLELLDLYGEINKDVNLYQLTLDKIIRVFERKLFLQEECDGDEGVIYNDRE